MNERNAAMERLLEAELATVFGREPRTAERPTRAWLIAALVLLGAAVAASTWLLSKQPPEPVQEPEPLPEATFTKNIAQLEDLPDDLVNLSCTLGEPADLARLQRFTQLRELRLMVAKIKVGNIRWGSHRSWEQPKASLLQGIAALPKLESLHLPRELALRPELLAELQRAPALRELHLGGERVVVDQALTAALAALPHLRRLSLQLADLDASKARLLATLPLGELILFQCRGFDASVLAALHSPSLHKLTLHGLGQPSMRDGGATIAWAPGPKDLHCLATMPALRELAFFNCTFPDATLGTMSKLRELTLLGCKVSDAMLASMPEQLTRLHLYVSSGFTAEELRQLHRLRGLQYLRFRERTGGSLVARHEIEPKAASAALAELLGLLRLQAFDFTGTATEPLLRAVALQPELTTLSLSQEPEAEPVPVPDFRLLANAPRLATLNLFNLPTLEAADLKPLSACRTLRRVEVNWCARCSVEEVRKLLPAVQVTGMPAQRK